MPQSGTSRKTPPRSGGLSLDLGGLRWRHRRDVQSAGFSRGLRLGYRFFRRHGRKEVGLREGFGCLVQAPTQVLLHLIIQFLGCYHRTRTYEEETGR